MWIDKYIIYRMGCTNTKFDDKNGRIKSTCKTII